MDLNNKIAKLHGKYEEICSQIESSTRNKLVLDTRIDRLKKLSTVFSFLIEKLLKQSNDSIENLLSYGLKSVYTDQDLSVRVDFEIKRSLPYLSIITVHKKGNKIIEGAPLRNFGGGVANIEGVLLRLLAIEKLNLRKFIVLDESFANVSSEYRENSGNLLKELANKLGFDILMVTQNRDISEHSDKNYWCSLNKEEHLYIKEV